MYGNQSLPSTVFSSMPKDLATRLKLTLSNFDDEKLIRCVIYSNISEKS
jgi:hypothetical protein